MRYQSYLNTASVIIGSYTGNEPLSLFLKKFFAAQKKYGSRDRKQIATICYHFYRLGKAVKHIPVKERILLATFLCEQSPSDFLQFHQPNWNEKITASVAEKIMISNVQFSITDIFPWSAELSDGIDHERLAASFLIQPDLFVRIRPGNKDKVLKKLEDAGLHFASPSEDCIVLPNSTKLDNILEPDKEIVVQDQNSQQVLNFLKDQASGIGDDVNCWDCCAASGGKSILLYDILNGNVELSVSDIRENILINLKKRFSAAGIKKYQSFIADLGHTYFPLPTPCFQLIICDAPCTGSGTWSRTPEQLFFFDTKTIDEFCEKQKRIVSGVLPHLKKGALFFYITCSVFKKENEEIIAFIKEKFQLQLLQLEWLKGYDIKADSMFVAVFLNQ